MKFKYLSLTLLLCMGGTYHFALTLTAEAITVRKTALKKAPIESAPTLTPKAGPAKAGKVAGFSSLAEEAMAKQQQRAAARAKAQGKAPQQPAQVSGQKEKSIGQASKQLWKLTLEGDKKTTDTAWDYIQQQKQTQQASLKAPRYSDLLSINSAEEAIDYILEKLKTAEGYDVTAYNADLQEIRKFISQSTYDTKIKALLDQNADPIWLFKNGANEEYSSALGNALRNYELTAFTVLLTGHPEYINKDAISSQPPLVYACNNQKLTIVDFLLQNNADVNVQTTSLETPLEAAITSRPATENTIINQMIEKLLRSGADPTKADTQGFLRRNITQSASEDSLNVAKHLLHALFVYAENTSIKNIRNHPGIIKKYLDFLMQLRKTDPGFNPFNTPFPYGKEAVSGKTPIELAAQNNHSDCLTAMFAVKDEEGKPLVNLETAYTALRAAQQNSESQKVLRMFIVTSYKTSPNQQNSQRIVMNYQQHAARTLKAETKTAEEILAGITQELKGEVK